MLIATLAAFALVAALYFARKNRTKGIQVVPIPVTACGACWTAYDLEEWKALQFVDKDGATEERQCECGQMLNLNASEYEQDYLTAPEYQRIWPNSARPQTRLFVFEPGKGVRSV